jgi:hypothetical protein
MKTRKISARQTARRIKTNEPRTHDEYLEALSDGKLAALDTLRKAIMPSAALDSFLPAGLGPIGVAVIFGVDELMDMAAPG